MTTQLDPVRLAKAKETSRMMLEARRDMKILFGAQYTERMREPKAMIKEIAERRKCSVLSAALELIQYLREKNKDGPLTTPVFSAAALDLIDEAPK